ncbi:MAG: DEAD/DEAH box helicase family protein, partial [Chloroflexota bacterium]
MCGCSLGRALSEADTCRAYVLPKLTDAGWDDDQIREQVTFTDGRIVVVGSRAARRKQKRADYVLRYRRDFPIAVVEAKAEYRHPADGLQQAKEYAEILDLRFAYATNGLGIIEYDYLTGETRELGSFPGPDELWRRLADKEGFTAEIAARLLTPAYSGKPLRYYQEIAVNRTVQAILLGRKRILLTLATGTGKTTIASQICWKLWNEKWNRAGRAGRKPKMLFLADRNILVDDPHSKEFAVFGDARKKLQGEVNTSREMYFAIYQAMDDTEWRPGLYRDYSPDFFDLIIVDECHRGSANEESSWHEILEYFTPAVQVGMTATPLRDDNRDTYAYFGDPIYQYSLKQGIEDGFLAPYRVHRIVTEWDVDGFRPEAGARDRYDREIPDRLYTTPQFERDIALKARTQAIAWPSRGCTKPFQ